MIRPQPNNAPSQAQANQTPVVSVVSCCDAATSPWVVAMIAFAAGLGLMLAVFGSVRDLSSPPPQRRTLAFHSCVPPTRDPQSRAAHVWRYIQMLLSGLRASTSDTPEVHNQPT